ncbi:LPS export ABC transporter periplasmic protein LptC [Polaromonas sp.]|uniref:LPS export ABC transporter periplasmic protein LptC n=1 Tax=Polaromonas sp. TaxID=1869339 RepID=UPI0032673F1B
MSTSVTGGGAGRNQGAPPSLKSMWRSFLRTWDSVAIYMPLLMMGVLALGTYWLVRNTPIFSPPEMAKEASHDVDYFMRKFTVKTFDEGGHLKSEIYGTEARHFSDTDILEIDQARIRSINVEKRITTATANRAYTNGDGSEVQLTGNAVVIREASQDANGKETPRMEFHGEFLHAFLNDERVKSHKPVLLIRGTDQFTGDTFAYDNLDQVADLKGRVRGILVPRSAASAASAGNLAFPGPAPALTPAARPSSSASSAR